MCGISAIYRFTQISESDKENLNLMNQEMHYRGPDENGIWADDICGLAHTRLAIIGLDNGKQPLFNEDRSLVLICNGEIYNYIELKQDLRSKGHYFNSDSDCETILHLYEEFGVKCLEYLRGMFVFCLWDTKKKRLFVARDRIGEKTLYYAQLHTGFIFSTELKVILKHFIDKPQINPVVLAEAIRYNYPLNLKNTWIDQIKKVQAGHFALIDESGIEIHRYWKRNSTPTFNGTFKEAKIKTLELIQESVNITLRSDVPIAILLSGGIDSSAIAVFAKESGKEIHTITAGYKGQHNCDERSIAKRFSKEQGLIYHEIELDENDFKEFFYEYTAYMDEPICDISSMSQWALYKKSKELGFKVLLSGLGGDELFFGYPYWNAVAKSLKLSHSHQAFFPWKGNKKKLDFLRFFISNWRHILWAGYPYKINDKTLVDWTYNDYMEFIKSAKLSFNQDLINFQEIEVHHSFKDHGDEIINVYEHNFNIFMTNLCLYLADRLGMGNSIEIRSPLIDHKLVEFISNLPTDFKIKNNVPKFFLKEVLNGILPPYILNSPKRGFTPPIPYIDKIVTDYKYSFIKADHKFFNSILSDQIINTLLN